MPSRKQRRRRAKELRHEYEVVYVDAEGREIEPPPEAERKPERENGDRRRKAVGRGRAASGRPRRIPQPPSWSRSGKRALMFFPIFLLAISLISKHTPLVSRFLTALAYSLLFVPLTYLMDRTAYRTYIRRGGTPAGGGSAKRR
jgi:hypothetical protein